jgi:hypothetical protein
VGVGVATWRRFHGDGDFRWATTCRWVPEAPYEGEGGEVRRGPNRGVKRCAVVVPLLQIPVRGGALRVGGGQTAPAGR